MPKTHKTSDRRPNLKKKPTRSNKPGKKETPKAVPAKTPGLSLGEVLAAKGVLPAGASVALTSGGRPGGGAAAKYLVVVPADVKERAQALRAKLAHKPGPDELLTPQERADAAPFYFQLRMCLKQLRDARETAGLTLAQVAEKTGLAAETLSRLETGMLTNPTWKTLALYAVAVGRKLTLSAQ
jgi:DNA-binding XRE family transcriptional regulator